MSTGTSRTTSRSSSFVVDQEKAALNGITDGRDRAHAADRVGRRDRRAAACRCAKEDVPIGPRSTALSARISTSIAEPEGHVGRDGQLVPFANWCEARDASEDKSIYHKNLMPVTYVTARCGGRHRRARSTRS